MADADEDLIPHSQTSSSSFSPTADLSADLEDEAQDFRFLTSLTNTKSPPGQSSTLPRRGEKDFEPNPTQAQSHTLAASREAMHNALSVERVLMPRNPLVGQYLPDPKDWRWDVMPTITRRGLGGRCVVVEKFRTTYARSCGVADYRNWTWLLPEEALFLIERGTLDVRWPDEKVGAFMKRGFGRGNRDSDEEAEVRNETGSRDGSSDDEDGEDEDVCQNHEDKEADGNIDIVVQDEMGKTKTRKKRRPYVPLQVGEMPMSLQGAYASFIGKSGLTLERYNVYAGLRRLGYIVLRAASRDDEEDEDNVDEQHTNGHASEPNGPLTQPLLSISTASQQLAIDGPSSSNPATTLINRLVAYLFTSKPLHYNPSHGPLIYPGLYRNYNDIFRALTLIPYHHATLPTTTSPSPNNPKAKPISPFTIFYHVHKPSPNTRFRKSAPPPPDFRVAVLDARTTSVPTAAEIGALLDSMPDDELPKEKRMEQRLKHGVRSVVLAVVDCGLVSYLRLADVVSGVNGRVHETKGTGSKGGKRGGGFRRGSNKGRGGRK